jgi:hypothetical protein
VKHWDTLPARIVEAHQRRMAQAVADRIAKQLEPYELPPLPPVAVGRCAFCERTYPARNLIMRRTGNGLINGSPRRPVSAGRVPLCLICDRIAVLPDPGPGL